MSKHTHEHSFNWTGYHLGPNSRTAVGDVDGDGELEAVAACCSNGGSGQLYLFAWDGKTFTKAAQANLGMIERIYVLVVADVAGNGKEDIIIGTDNYFFIYRWIEGRLTRVYQSRYLGGRVVDIAVGRVTGYPGRELVVAIRGVGVRVYRWQDGAFSNLWQLDAPNARVAVGNVDGDALEEIVILQTGRGPGRDIIDIYTYREGNFIVEYNIRLNVTATGPIEVADLTRNGRSEIFLATDGGRRVLVLTFQNQEFQRIGITDSMPGVVRALAGANWSRRAGNELIIGLHNAIIIYRIEGGRLVLEANIETPARVIDLSYGDLDKDGRVEIVIGTESGEIYFLRVIIKVELPIRKKPILIIEPKAQFLVQENVMIPERFPDLIKVARVDAKPIVTSTDVIPNKVIIRGFFVVDFLVVVEPDRRVLSFEQRIPFVHFVHIPGLTRRHRVKVDVDVVYIDFRFDPRSPRQIHVVIVAEVFIFDYIVRRGDTIKLLADKWEVTEEVIIDINKLGSRQLEHGQRLMTPILDQSEN
ncbi:hypothetical protein GGQ84_000202 [Desulfitispora alkaliphila]|uniref:FG-GAP-like repeat-containing protein n=1 Tax=Desulfitispora alkaliphila TaxID=622674 RepID=UPI003D1D1CF0